MSEPATTSTATARAMRDEFDRSFSQAPATQVARFVTVLAVRIRSDAYVIPATAIRALLADRRVVALPTPMTELLGVTTFRGQVVPVYDLAALLGYAHRGAPRTVPRWFVLAGERDLVAFAFDAFERLLPVPPEHVVSPVEPDAKRPHLRGAVRAGEALRPIVHLPSVLDDVQKRVAATILRRSDEL